MEQNDLAEAAVLFNMFKGARDHFSTDDKRCKIVDIDVFYTGSHWSVERWWTREERIDLGIEDEAESVTVEEFISLVEDTVTTLTDFQEPLREIAKKKIQSQNSVEVSLSDKTLFELSIGKRVLRKDFQTPRGDIPVYSANVFTPFVYSDSSNIADAAAPYVIWGIDGLFEFNVVGMRTPFATTDHCGAIKILNPNIDPFFLAYMLRETSHIYGFDRGLRASLTNMKNVKIIIPTTESGAFDVEYQRFIAQQLESVGQVKEEIKQKTSHIAGASVNIDLSDYSMVYRPITELFTIERGSGKYTKTYTQGHFGKYPLFSGNTFGEFAFIDSYDYDTPCLTWVIDGLAGYMTAHKTPFSATNHRGILLPKTANIDIDYIKFALEPLFRQAKKGRVGDNGENEYTSLPPFMLKNIEVGIPVDGAGKISLDLQREIAASYLTIEQYRREILHKLDAILVQRIEY
jgi:restriction endonuclease S subunit